MIISSITALRERLNQERNSGKTIGFVPTMGYLHEGHLSLIKTARSENDVVVVSVFVNPTQFAPGEDYEVYPRDIDRDTDLAVGAGADVVFHPSVEEMYPGDSSSFVEVEGSITRVLCGQSRPTHFKGVTTVVNMLFNIVQPDRAYFGQKDAQQAAVLIKMVEDLHIPVKIIVCPIVREPDGLAMSSRNSYLSKQERTEALILNKSLQVAAKKFSEGEIYVEKLTKLIQENIDTMPLASIDYISILDYPSLETIKQIKQRALVAIAVKFGKTRLIDNIVLEITE